MAYSICFERHYRLRWPRVRINPSYPSYSSLYWRSLFFPTKIICFTNRCNSLLDVRVGREHERGAAMVDHERGATRWKGVARNSTNIKKWVGIVLSLRAVEDAEPEKPSCSGSAAGSRQDLWHLGTGCLRCFWGARCAGSSRCSCTGLATGSLLRTAIPGPSKIIKAKKLSTTLRCLWTKRLVPLQRRRRRGRSVAVGEWLLCSLLVKLWFPVFCSLLVKLWFPVLRCARVRQRQRAGRADRCYFLTSLNLADKSIQTLRDWLPNLKVAT